MAEDPATPSSRPGLRVADATWDLIAQRAAGGAIGVLPVGAASKQHGLHLPMCTDWLQAEWLAGELAGRAGVLVWPTLPYGHYPAFTDYPGSTSLSAPTFTALVAEILEGIRRSGVTRCLVLNTGVSTIAPLEAAMSRVAGFAQLRLANVYNGPRFAALEQQVRRQPRGGHADEIETCLMLALHPQRVDMGRAVAWAGRAVQGRFSRADPGSPGYSPSGVYGDPTLATREKGMRLLDAMLGDVLDFLGGMVGDRD